MFPNLLLYGFKFDPILNSNRIVPCLNSEMALFESRAELLFQFSIYNVAMQLQMLCTGDIIAIGSPLRYEQNKTFILSKHSIAIKYKT